MRTSSTRLHAQPLGTEITGGQIPVNFTGFYYIFEMFPAGVLQRCQEQYICYRARYAMLVHVQALHASDGGTGC